MNRNQKGFASIILIIIIVALAVAGAYFVSSRQSTTRPTLSPMPTPIPSPVHTPVPKPTPTPTPSPTPVPTPKQAIEDQYNQERAASTQNPAPKNPDAPYPIAPEEPFKTGFIDAEAVFNAGDAIVCNGWRTMQNGAEVRFYGTVDASDRQQGIVYIDISLPYPAEPSFQRILTPVKDGQVCIIAAQDGVLTLLSDTGSHITFNIGTRTFSVAAGDLNGDGKADCSDLAIVRASFGKRRGQLGFDPRADTNNDDVVNVRDLAFVAQKLPAGTHCP